MFEKFAKAVNTQYNHLAKQELYKVDVDLSALQRFIVSGGNHQELIEHVLSDLYNNLVDSRQELGTEFESVLYENIEELYEN